MPQRVHPAGPPKTHMKRSSDEPGDANKRAKLAIELAPASQTPGSIAATGTVPDAAEEAAQCFGDFAEGAADQGAVPAQCRANPFRKLAAPRLWTVNSLQAPM